MITIFTDGAARGNPGPGGWGTIIVSDDFVFELGDRETYTTNNRMEMTAVISALEFLDANVSINKDQKHNIKIVTDSAYVLNGSTRWMFGWRKNNWKRIDSETKKEAELQNSDLWQKIFELIYHRVIDWQLVRGHSGHPGNERCDKIATDFADNKNPVLYKGQLHSYSINILTDFSKEKSVVKKSKTRAYSYVSLVDGKINIHKKWEDCKNFVHGKSNAKYKKSVSPEDEENIIKNFLKN